MYLHLASGFLLIAVCSSESPKPAVSSIRVHRDDIPLSYEYSSIHTYSTENPRNDYVRPQLKVEYTTPYYENIQYAPLIVNKQENNNLYTQAIVGNRKKIHSITNRENLKSHLRQLEPRHHNYNKTLQRTPIKLAPTKVISGYNIDSSASNKVRYDNKFLLKQPNNNDHVAKVKKSPVINLNIDMNESLRLKTVHNIFEKRIFPDEKPVKTVQVLLAMEKAQIQPALEYAKMPQLHLNVARSYNIARTPYKAQYKNNQINRHKTPLEPRSLFYPMSNIKFLS